MEFDPRDYAAEFEHAKANLATRTAEAHSAQFRAAGHEKDSRELAVHLYLRLSGYGCRGARR
jgi:multidrug resistance efflux pump